MPSQLFSAVPTLLGFNHAYKSLVMLIVITMYTVALKLFLTNNSLIVTYSMHIGRSFRTKKGSCV